MKHQLTLVFVLLAFLSNSQKLHLDTESNLLTVDTVVNVNDSLNPSNIYNKVKKWTASNFKNPEKVIISDITNEDLVLKYITKFKISGVSIDFYVRIQLKFKSGKFKFILAGVSEVDHNYSLESYLLKKDNTLRDNSPSTKLKTQVEEEALKQINAIYNEITKVEKW